MNRGEPIEVPGFNVIQIARAPRTAGGSWCVVFNPDSPDNLTVGESITVPLDERLFRGGLPSPGTVIDAGMLTLTVVGDAGANTCQLVVGGSAWDFDTSAYRPTLVTAFTAFMEAAEQLEKSSLQPGATEILGRCVAARVPATYAESLYMRHGVVSRDDRTYFDLQPGMRVAFDFEERQFVPLTADPASGLLSGFVGGATVTTDVVSLPSSTGSPCIGVHPFLSAVRLPQVDAPKGGFAGLIDLVAVPRGPLRHMRVCYPPTFPGADSRGYAGAGSNVAVLGANDRATLRIATDEYYATGHAAGLLGFFRGRTVVHPQLPVLLGGSRPSFVPAGTTLRQLLERHGPVPRLPGVVDADTTVTLSYRRRQGGMDVTAIYKGVQQLVVDSNGGPDPVTGVDGLDFPVLAADTFDQPGVAHA